MSAGRSDDAGVVVLAARGLTSYLLINHLAARFDVRAVVFEEQDRWRLFRYRWRKLGPRRALGQLAFALWDAAVISPRSAARTRALLQGHDVTPPDGRLPTIDVTSVNGTEVADLIAEHQPAVVVVSGTGIIRPHVLESGPRFVNIHCGITPRYRGVHGGFWAIYEGRPDLAGVTVHMVDAGVDTGGIVGQATIAVDLKSDTYRTLPVRQYLAGCRLMEAAVKDLLDGTAGTIERNDLSSRQWYTPTLVEYVRYCGRVRALRRRSRRMTHDDDRARSE